MATRKSRTHTGTRLPALVTGGLIVVLLVVGMLAFAFVVSFVRGSLAVPGGKPGVPQRLEPSEHVSYDFGQLLPTWSGTERVTVLVMGVDERAQESGPWRTDTMMLLTIDPVTREAGVLSIPRDLWVPIPGYPDGRINTAHFLGELYHHPGGGPGLAVETVEYNLGVKIDYYVRINFRAFVTLVDQIGGIDVYVEKPINDPLYPDYSYGYDPLYIEAGWHHFDGEMALKYARTRHGSSDFDRARRQQQVLTAILDRVTSYELLPQLARSAPELYETLADSVDTDLALDQILALANLASAVEPETIRFGVIDETCTQPWVTPDGAQVLVPLRDQMRAVRDYVFASELSAQNSPETNGTLLLPTPTPELATIAVLNGTTRPGLAGATAEYLRTQGIEVSHVGNADRQDYASTLIVMNRDKPRTQAALLKSLRLDSTSVMRGQDPQATYDVIIVLGKDFVLPAAP